MLLECKKQDQNGKNRWGAERRGRRGRVTFNIMH